MASETETTKAHQATPRWVWLAVAGLLALYAGLAFTASLHKGVSYDEGEELAVGYDIWLHQDFRMEGANGDLVKRWATLPFLFSQPNFPNKDNEYWRTALPYVLGYEFLFESNNQTARLLEQGRAMAVLLGLATALLVFYCGKEIFGPLGGLFSLALFVFSPDMLAFGGIVSTEMSICLTLLGSTWGVWRLLHRVSWGRLLAGLGFLALLFLAKATALVIFPITAILVAAKLLGGRPLEWRLGRARTVHSRTAQTAIFLTMFFVSGIWCWLCLWAHYDFRYAASPEPSNPLITAWAHTGKKPLNPTLQAVLTWSRRTHILPEGYLDGIELLSSENQQHETFMNGHWSEGNMPAFFPYTIWAKTPPALLLLFGLGLAWWLQRGRLSAKWKKLAWPGLVNPVRFLYDAIPFITLVVILITVAIAQHLDIAHRHILPIYPALDILAGGSAALVWLRHKRWMNGVIALLLIWYAGDSLTIYPNYLSYFSPTVGGPAFGYEHLVESSLDWGMDLPGLKQWLKVHNPGDHEMFYLSYFGTDNPDYYGIKSTRLPSFPSWERQGVYDFHPGVYAISATLLQSFYVDTEGPWNPIFEEYYQKCVNDLEILDATAGKPLQRAALLKKYPEPFWSKTYENFKKLRFGRLCAWLRHNRKPDDNVGHTILIWRLNQAELDDALHGTPAEMAGAPLNLQLS